MRRRVSRCFKVLFVATVLILGQSASAFALDSKDQKPAAKSEPKLVQTATASGVAYGGEGGGPNSLQCPSGQVVTGVSVSPSMSSMGYNYALAITCSAVSLSTSQTLTLASTGTKTNVFAFSTYTPSLNSNCSTGFAVSSVRVYMSSNYPNGFASDLGSNCKSFPSQATSETIAPGKGLTGNTMNTSSCEAGSFVTGVYGRNGEGIDKFGVYCSAFSVGTSTVTEPAFVSYLQRDLVLMSTPSFTRYGDFYLCSAGSYGYKWSRMPSASAEKTTLDSVTMILRVDKKIVGVASSDDFKSLPRWVFGIDDALGAAKILDGNVVWAVPGSARSSDVTCEVVALKENQIRYSTLSNS